MSSVSQGQEQQPSVSDKKRSGESQQELTPEQVRAGTKTMMSHAERQAFWQNSRLGQLLGFSRWSEQKESDS